MLPVIILYIRIIWELVEAGSQDKDYSDCGPF